MYYTAANIVPGIVVWFDDTVIVYYYYGTVLYCTVPQPNKGVPAWRLIYLYSITVDFSPTFYCRAKPLLVYGSTALLSYIIYYYYRPSFVLFDGPVWRLM